MSQESRSKTRCGENFFGFTSKLRETAWSRVVLVIARALFCCGKLDPGNIVSTVTLCDLRVQIGRCR
jgi:hypothetical protein